MSDNWNDDGFGEISITHFIEHGFNQNCSLHNQVHCQQYNASYSKYYCNGGYIRFGVNYNTIKNGLYKRKQINASNIFSNGIHVHHKLTLHRI
eukprot:393364_1